MTPQQLDLAHEFCEHVGKTDLLDYLGLERGVSAEDARTALKASRRRMQGMQSNPKYREEARLLIRNFQALDSVLGDIPLHLEDMSRRREAAQLPILELTIRGVLAGGSLGMEQKVFLRNHARELGVSDATFDAVLDRLSRDAGLPNEVEGGRRSPLSTPPPAPATPAPAPAPSAGPPPARAPASGPPAPPSPHGVPRTPAPVPSTTAVPPSPSATPTGPPRGAPPRVPTGPTGPGRMQGPLGAVSTSTPPPQPRKARPGLWANPAPATRLNPVRDIDPLAPAPLTEAATAPPVRARVAAPPPPGDVTTVPRAVARDVLGEAAFISLLGAPIQRVEILGRKPVTVDVMVRLLGELPVGATVTADDPWLTVQPSRLEATAGPQVVRATVHPDRMYKPKDRSTLRLQSDLGDQVTVEFIAERRFNWQGWFLGFSVVGSFALLTLALVLAVSWLMVPTTGRSLTIHVDPQAESVWVDNKVVGHGGMVVVRDPPAGEVEISVTQYNFKPVVQKVVVKAGADQTVTIRMDLDNDLEFRPGPDDVEDRPQGTEADRLEVMSSLEPCMGETPPAHPPYSGTVLLYLDQEGRVSGVQLVGRDPVPVGVKDCFFRRAATVRYPKLKAGTFARLPVEFRYP